MIDPRRRPAMPLFSTLSASTNGGVLVGSILVRTITLASVAVACGTIAISYILAVSLGHVPAWLPMISDCAVKAPEMFLFRYGLLVSATLLAANVLVVFAATRSSYKLSKVTLVNGLIAAFSMGMLTAVNEDEDNNVHSGTVLAAEKKSPFTTRCATVAVLS